MDLLTALKILIRQWPVVLGGLVLTFVGLTQVGGLVKPTYQAKATVILLGPGTGNRLLNFDANLEVTADALILVMHSDAGVERVEAAGAEGVYELERPNGPLIDINGSAPTSEDATATVEHVLTVLEEQLQTAQADAADTERITFDILTEPVAVPQYGSRIRAQAAVGALGLTLTVTAGLLTDALRRNRRERRASAAGDETQETGFDEPGHGEVGRDEVAGRSPAHDEPRHNEVAGRSPAHDEPRHNEVVAGGPAHDEPRHYQAPASPAYAEPVRNELPARRPAADKRADNGPVENGPVENTPVAEGSGRNGVAEERPGRDEPAEREPATRGSGHDEPTDERPRHDHPAHQEDADRTSSPAPLERRGTSDERVVEPPATPVPSEAPWSEGAFVGAAAAAGQDPWILRAAARVADRGAPTSATPQPASGSRWSTPAPRTPGEPARPPMVERPPVNGASSRRGRANGRPNGRKPRERPEPR